MHWEVIDKNRYNILEKIIKKTSLEKYYLAGGTALALQTGIRESFDFDFFVQTEFDENLLIQELEEIGDLEVTVCRKGTVHAILNDVQITFLYFENNLVEDKVTTEDIKGLYLASIKDIAIMKLIAISQRGTKKDFFDLYYICNNFDITIKEILDILDKKYDKNKINYLHIIQSLAYFEDAEDENLPKVFIKYDWNTIKKYYINEQKKIYSEN
ncbi:MAG: nucleotidyl transferase AbiEii/AbiGii toxin family protein [Clostridia bacterium]